jgi:glycosyltransferase involved in cell wall biosynthesis
MNLPLINIITRCSRPKSFERCKKSIESQTYKNIHHIVTYQNDEIKEFLGKFEGLHKIRVPNLKAIEGLAIKYYTHPRRDNFLNPDWEWLETKGVIDFTEGGKVDWPFKPEPTLTIWEGNIYHNSADAAYVTYCKHFPYNIFLKIADQHTKEGWVMYLDDDDYLERDTAIEELVEEINKHNEDTLHLVNIMSNYGRDVRDPHIVRQMKGGMPFIYGCIGGSSIIFHTKYIEYTAWDEWSGSDWRTAKCLEAVIPKKNWIDNYFIKLGGINPDGASRGNLS